MKKRILSLLLFAGVLAAFSSCDGADAATNYSPLQIADEIVLSQNGLSGLHTLTLEDEEFSAYLSGYYSMERELLDDGVICYAGGTEASEIAVFSLKAGTDSKSVEDALVQYIENRTGDFYGYMPDQVLMLEQAVVAVNGSYVALLICEEPLRAQAAFIQCFDTEPVQQASLAAVHIASVSAPMVQKSKASYDSSAVLEAWRTGDSSQLSEKNLSILEACTRAIDEVIDEHMSEYEKELAIHDWIVEWAEYDAESKSHAPDARPDPDNDNPYGLLVGRRAICTGYTTTFQLLMDILEIECITVQGTSRGGLNEHAWNMVRLDGEWYCVDITWNDPLRLEEYDSVVQHKYFNVTSEFMLESNHQWDMDATPQATATLYRWRAPESA